MIEGEIKDLAGCRLILYTNADVERFLHSRAIFDNFEIDQDRTKFHYPASVDATEGLFISYNYVVRLKDNRTALPEYADLAGLWCEIQVQTTLGHAWSEMSHDTMYKRPQADFGTRALDEVNRRMNEIMRKYLLPADFDFQKIASDVERLRIAHEAHGRDPLKELREAPDNNVRHDVLKRFNDYVLPNYDDYQKVAAELRPAMVEIAELARATPTVQQGVHGYKYRGHEPAEIAALALDTIDYVSMIDAPGIIATFEALARLYAGSTAEEEHKRILKSVERLSKNQLAIFGREGPVIQRLLIDHLATFNTAETLAIRPLVLEVLENALSPECSRTQSTYNQFVITQAAIVASPEQRAVRADAIGQLSNLIDAASDDGQKLAAIRALQTATRRPHHGATPNELIALVATDTLAVSRILREIAATASFELRETIEHDALWMLRHHGELPPDLRDDEVLTGLRDDLVAELHAIRDEVNSDTEFVIFKRLVGFEAVFLPEWEKPTYDFDGDGRDKDEALDALIADVDEPNFPTWIARLVRCCETTFTDGATFGGFNAFVAKLGKSHPSLVAGLLADFPPAMGERAFVVLLSLQGGPEAKEALRIANDWVAAGRNLDQVAIFCEASQDLPAQLLEDCLAAAIAANANWAVTLAVHASGRHMLAQPAMGRAVFLPAIRHLAGAADFLWLRTVRFDFGKNVFSALSEAEIDELLRLMIPHREISTDVEDVLLPIAHRWPLKVIDFFGERVRYERTTAEPRTLDTFKNYDAIPYSFHRLHTALQAVPAELVTKNRAWYDEDDQLFSHRGGELISRVFPQFVGLEAPMAALVASGNDRDIDYVLAALRLYQGQVALHPLCQQIVEALAADDLRLELVEIIIDSTGVMTGEFGGVEALTAKRTLMTAWLDDPREKVRRFAERHIRHLERDIAADQRRSVEELEFRKRHYGETLPSNREG